MLDMTLFRQPAFLGVSIATFCIGAGMFALFPYLSIYLQDVLGFGPLGAGVRFLPLTAFVFTVPILMRKFAPAASLWLQIAVGLGARRRCAAPDVRPHRRLVVDRPSRRPDRRRDRHRPREPGYRRRRLCVSSTRPAPEWRPVSTTPSG